MVRKIKAKLVLQLLAEGLSGRSIAASRNSVASVLNAADVAGVRWDDIADLPDAEVYPLLLLGRSEHQIVFVERDLAQVRRVMTRVGVTMKMIRRGQTSPVTWGSVFTRRRQLDTKQDTWLRAHVAMFEPFGGSVPRVVFSDNPKTGVIKHPREGGGGSVIVVERIFESVPVAEQGLPLLGGAGGGGLPDRLRRADPLASVCAPATSHKDGARQILGAHRQSRRAPPAAETSG